MENEFFWQNFAHYVEAFHCKEYKAYSTTRGLHAAYLSESADFVKFGREISKGNFTRSKDALRKLRSDTRMCIVYPCKALSATWDVSGSETSMMGKKKTQVLLNHKKVEKGSCLLFNSSFFLIFHNFSFDFSE